jgi:O-antigen/teichoic acid export membrane protein
MTLAEFYGWIDAGAVLCARVSLAVIGVAVLFAAAAWALTASLGSLLKSLGYWWAFVRFYPHRDRWATTPPKPRAKAPTINDPPLELPDDE